uniref:Uncharacterized protein n=1 Tax=Oryza barthii TaxID=65489 RepID=A0A0D3ET59_9ORYZ
MFGWPGWEYSSTPPRRSVALHATYSACAAILPSRDGRRRLRRRLRLRLRRRPSSTVAREVNGRRLVPRSDTQTIQRTMAQALVQPEEVPDFTNRERDQLEFMRHVCNYAMGDLLSASFVAVSANTLDIPEFTRRYLAVNACAFFLYALPTAALAHSVSREWVWFNIVSATVLVLSLYTVASAFALIQVFGNVPRTLFSL